MSELTVKFLKSLTLATATRSDLPKIHI